MRLIMYYIVSRIYVCLNLFLVICNQPLKNRNHHVNHNTSKTLLRKQHTQIYHTVCDLCVIGMCSVYASSGQAKITFDEIVF